jgi:hypothetical protein
MQRGGMMKITQEWLKEKSRSERYKIRNKEKVYAKWRACKVHRKRELCSFKNCNELGERHHPDYGNPETIIWLCRKHHNMIHGKVKKICLLCEKNHHAKGFCREHYHLIMD